VTTTADQALQGLDQQPGYTPADLANATPLKNLEDQEEQRLESLKEDNLAWDAEVEDDETRPWPQYTKWPEQFASRPLDIISAASRLPEPCPKDADYSLGYLAGKAIVYLFIPFTSFISRRL
jgi:hypothetical protein